MGQEPNAGQTCGWAQSTVSARRRRLERERETAPAPQLSDAVDVRPQHGRDIERCVVPGRAVAERRARQPWDPEP